MVNEALNSVGTVEPEKVEVLDKIVTVREILIGAGMVFVGAVAIYAIYAFVKYIQEQRELGITPERSYFDEVNINEIKQWFSEKIDSEDVVGVLFYPTEDNLKKWKLDMDVADNIIIQITYNKKSNEVVSYREIAFDKMSAKLRDLLDSNGGTVILAK